MYAKCGNIRIARSIFDKMDSPDKVSWTAMIMGYASHGHANEALLLFHKMRMENVRSNYVAFVAALTACSHGGLVDEARMPFNCMIEDYGIYPGLEHYTAVVDLLGRAGKLEEAYDFIFKMHRRPTGYVWGLWATLLSSCRVHKNIELAERVGGKVFQIDPENIGAYILMSKIYSSAGRWKEPAKMRMAMKGRGMTKKPACTWIEVKNKIHAFLAGDKSHPHYYRINKALKVMLEQMERKGYVLSTDNVLGYCVVIVRVNLQILLIIRNPGVHTGMESRCKSLSPTAAALSLLNQSKVKLELCSEHRKAMKGSCRSQRQRGESTNSCYGLQSLYPWTAWVNKPCTMSILFMVPDHSYAVSGIFIKRLRGWSQRCP
ncbi:hypothetical protein MKW98_014454 [Papaver atlanticum]|uniref:Pentatricopeptide repeat-containing protein n=1 Tax=Papaver atlanticum TaxID=357466 RepID=A0AAD4S0I0_9MAGN|nr:hypothetical protein MKW98_014454 [Papaver atlanticum]